MEYKNPKLKIMIPNKFDDVHKSKNFIHLEELCNPFLQTDKISDVNFDKFTIYVIDKSYKLKLNIHSQKQIIVDYIKYIINKENLNTKYIKYKLKHKILDDTIFDILLLKKQNSKCCC